MNTYSDLKEEVQYRLHDALDGEKINRDEGVPLSVPHMIGVTSINAIHTHHAEEGTLLDPHEEFWNEYEEEVNTPNGALRRVKEAISDLREDRVFELREIHGEDSPIVLCVVEPVDGYPDNEWKSPCPECGRTVDTQPDLELTSSSGYISLLIDCDCGFSGAYETTLPRL